MATLPVGIWILREVEMKAARETVLTTSSGPVSPACLNYLYVRFRAEGLV